MPEWQTRPANQYLPRRITAVAGATTSAEVRDAGNPPAPARGADDGPSATLPRR